MQLVTFSDRNNDKLRVGMFLKSGGKDVVLDLSRADAAIPSTMRELLLEIDGNFTPLTDIAKAAPLSAMLPKSEIKLGPVVPNPEKVICIGLNYRDHAQETNHELPKVPTVFAKYSNTLIGDGEAIMLPTTTNQVDYEAELAFIIGRRAKDVSENDALNYVAGYTIFNDVSGRDYQLRTSQWTLGKSFDTFGPIGPALVTTDEVADPQTLGIRLRIGDEVLQSSNTSHMIFGVAFLIQHLSSAMTLEPGDIVATGTPAGVGFTRKPPRFLKAGEVVSIEIDKLGVLQNPVKQA